MLDFTTSFRVINKDTYHFFIGSIFSKKAYIVNALEKNKIENILRGSYKKATYVTLPGVVISFYNLWIFLFFISLISCFIYIEQRKSIKKIIGNRKIIVTESLGFLKQLYRKVNKMSDNDLRTCIYFILFLSITMGFIIFDIVCNKRHWLILALPFLLYGLIMFLICSFLYLKKNKCVENHLVDED